MHNRLKELRNKLGKSRVEFASAIMLSPQALGNLETGARPITERNFNEICRVFNVNPIWLRTGEGEMFNPARGQTYLDQLCEEYELDGLSRQVFERYLSFPPEQRQIIASWILTTFDFVEEMEREIKARKAERRKELEKAVEIGEAAKKEIAKMDAEDQSNLIKESLSETG